MQRKVETWSVADIRPVREAAGDGTMVPEDFLDHMERLGLSTLEMAAFLGLSKAHIYRYRKGDTPIPTPVAHLLRLMVKYDVKPSEPVFRQ